MSEVEDNAGKGFYAWDSLTLLSVVSKKRWQKFRPFCVLLGLVGDRLLVARKVGCGNKAHSRQ